MQWLSRQSSLSSHSPVDPGAFKFSNVVLLLHKPASRAFDEIQSAKELQRQGCQSQPIGEK